MADVCPFCKTSAFGCSPGRCFSPRGKLDGGEKPKPTTPSAPKVLAPPLGIKRIVLAQHVRSGANGGLIRVVELECGHVIWRREGRRPRTAKMETCIDCGEPLVYFCACGCGRIAELGERFKKWFWFNGAWFAPGHGIRADSSALLKAGYVAPEET